MSREIDEYNVELRVHFERDGEDDYTEDDYQFKTEEEAMKFANKNAGEVHDVLVYYKDGGNKSIW
jgi:hypothetical protein